MSQHKILSTIRIAGIVLALISFFVFKTSIFTSQFIFFSSMFIKAALESYFVKNDGLEIGPKLLTIMVLTFILSAINLFMII